VFDALGDLLKLELTSFPARLPRRQDGEGPPVLWNRWMEARRSRTAG
jgi:hypothetical protein